MIREGYDQNYPRNVSSNASDLLNKIEIKERENIEFHLEGGRTGSMVTSSK